MKQLLLLVFFLPFAAQGQSFKISAQTGYSFTPTLPEEGIIGGLSTQLILSYPFSRTTMLSVFYEYNIWKPGRDAFTRSDVRDNQGGGISFDFMGKYLYAGPSLGITKFADVNDDTNGVFKYMPRIYFGIHAGLRQKLGRQLYLTENVSMSWVPVKGTFYYTASRHGIYNYTDDVIIRKSLHVLGVRVGLIYELGYTREEKKRIAMDSDTKVGKENRATRQEEKAKNKREKQLEKQQRRDRTTSGTRYLLQ